MSSYHSKGLSVQVHPLVGGGDTQSALSQDKHDDDSPRKARKEESGGIVWERQDAQYLNSAPLGLCHELWLGTSKKFPAEIYPASPQGGFSMGNVWVQDKADSSTAPGLLR